MNRLKSFLPCLAVLSVFCLLTEQAGLARRSPALLNQISDPPEAKVEIEPVMTGLDRPVYLTDAGDGSERVFIAELPGRVKALPPGALSPTVFLDITAKVRTGGEDGLLGLAFHPEYEDNRRFYVCYTRVPDGALVIAEYRVSRLNPDVAVTDERALLVIPQPSEIHHGGMIDFGPDGFLYISTGDAFWEDPSRSAQDKESLRGKILRIDVDGSTGARAYSTPATNPFFGEAPGRDEVYATGFRNPFRFSFDSADGRLYVGDVGHHEREEINIVTAGGNYGWRVFEGTLCTNLDSPQCGSLQTVPPLIEYDHAGGRCSVTAGYVYRGAQGTLPAGSYVYGDFCTGEIFLFEDGATQLLLDTGLNITSFGEDEDGEIYVVGIGGTVHRLSIPSVQEPQIRIDSIQVRNRSTGDALEPVVVKKKGKKFDLVARGSGFAEGTVIFINGRKMNTEAGSTPGSELVARLRLDTLSQPGPLVIEAVTPDGLRSNRQVIDVLIAPDK
jgi:glucose/arabinose dehydrogenase